MTQCKDNIKLRHMLEHSREAVKLAEGKSRKDLDSDRKMELALTRLVEIIGEAAARVSNQTQNGYSEIPWSEIIGLRNRLIHGYDAVDMDILWEIIQVDLPGLIADLDIIIKELRE
ncbi:hypothetical protein L21SP3_00225 [Sedimentisphaera cyanobacteriorum]|uniref:DUF86 domain-containing protein n=1 Tax=Sedimentisphaera cyanobacteriorum TaxID=1940790 RepID=A0A1Q2HLJ9_9BACT|nr:HepT-like ribonuclease domain-containing protein [Sedimentisphaera cyanobacteriorum]AQQ08449.1 hypothetical protein L21SP3_00225 [Sedimentisphaera cyanobacteriorum]